MMMAEEREELIERLRRSTPLVALTPVQARAAFGKLLDELGYTLNGVEAPAAGLGSELSDDDTRVLVGWLQTHTAFRLLNFVDMLAVTRGIAQAGYVLRKPSNHPSGLRTTEQATTKVVPLGAGFVKAGSPVVSWDGRPQKAMR